MLGENRLGVNPEQERYNQIANELDALQADKNHGRGLNVVRDVVGLLRRGKHHEAKSHVWFDSERLDGHDDVKDFIRDNLFDGNPNWMSDMID